ncbi:MAG: hypothetical protein AB8C84_04700 [Oligoflexales bacterium]
MNLCLSKNIEAISHFSWPFLTLIMSILFYKQFQLLFTKIISLLDRVSTIKSGKTEVILSDATQKEIKTIKKDLDKESDDAQFERQIIQSLSYHYFDQYFFRKEGKIQTSHHQSHSPMIIDAIFHNQTIMILLETVKGKQESSFITSCNLARAVNFLKGQQKLSIFGLLAAEENDHIEDNPDYFVLRYDSNKEIINREDFHNWLQHNHIDFSKSKGST